LPLNEELERRADAFGLPLNEELERHADAFGLPLNEEFDEGNEKIPPNGKFGGILVTHMGTSCWP
jgi:hypothetical protein